MRITPLASGSSGNSFLVEGNGCAVLVDAGLSAKQLTKRIETAGADPESLSGILVSHGHSDHVKGVGVLSRRFRIPVLANRRTWEAIQQGVGKVHSLEFFETGRVFEFAGFRVHPFSVPHDCADPVGFRISRGTARLGIATDLGTATGLVLSLLTDLQVLVLESNHDPRMLRDGPYPWELKQRVKGRLGHLSNNDTAQVLQRIVTDELQAVILAHMSQTNNTSELALNCAASSLTEFLDSKGTLCCASQDEVGPTIEW
ncbi:MAG: MBL fold metallo-hydrolase [Desulfomonile tiedjei]|uniref:MBL fold metallo-hydrolase n=1 Tax=Desulfomonile tiedjei TaxID=2358 RepID=A0A9D6V5W6_9BACT|nr:MBL fold metallo-hydrolase [Desulfomonile tiedjei]